MADVQLLIQYVKQKLSFQLNTHALPDEYYYQSLTLSAIDAVFSAQARYPSVKSVIKRYCIKNNLTTFREPRDCLPLLEDQEKISDLIQAMEQKGVSYFVENIFENRSKTAGRLKAEILLDLLNKIHTLNIQTFQDIQPWLIQSDKQRFLISTLTEIRGIGEATSRYFLMLSGDDQMVKPDTMILRFIRIAIGRQVHEVDAVLLIQAVSRGLLPDYPHINPRLLDYLIWSWQRNKSDSKKVASSRQGSTEICINEQRQNNYIQHSKREKTLTIPQKTQKAMFKRYKSGELLSSTQIKDDVLTDYPGTPRDSVMPPDYCCNRLNKSPASGIYHIFFFEKSLNKYRLLPKQDVTMPRQRGNCP